MYRIGNDITWNATIYLKTTIVIPWYEKVSIDLKSNYRPNSLKCKSKVGDHSRR